MKPNSDLHKLLGTGDWSTEPVDGAGSPGRSWIAADGDRRLFLKQGVNVELLRGLAAVDVAPSIVAARGDLVAQELISGASPSARWIDEHIESVVADVSRYQAVAALRDLVPALSRTDCVRVLSARLPATGEQRLQAAFKWIASQPLDEAVGDPTLTHGDLNASNLLVTRDGALYLIDWEDAHTSDPMRDIGPLLWWYVRPARWDSVLGSGAYGDGGSAHNRVFWWAAARSIDVALWALERGDFIWPSVSRGTLRRLRVGWPIRAPGGSRSRTLTDGVVRQERQQCRRDRNN